MAVTTFILLGVRLTTKPRDHEITRSRNRETAKSRDCELTKSRNPFSGNNRLKNVWRRILDVEAMLFGIYVNIATVAEIKRTLNTRRSIFRPAELAKVAHAPKA